MRWQVRILPFLTAPTLAVSSPSQFQGFEFALLPRTRLAVLDASNLTPIPIPLTAPENWVSADVKFPGYIAFYIEQGDKRKFRFTVDNYYNYTGTPVYAREDVPDEFKIRYPASKSLGFPDNVMLPNHGLIAVKRVAARDGAVKHPTVLGWYVRVETAGADRNWEGFMTVHLNVEFTGEQVGNE